MTIFHTIKIAVIVGLFFIIAVSSANAAGGNGANTPYPLSIADRTLEVSGAHIGTIGERVINPRNRSCNSIKDCREKGQNLYKISLFNGTDFSAVTQYPSKNRRYDITSGGYMIKTNK